MILILFFFFQDDSLNTHVRWKYSYEGFETPKYNTRSVVPTLELFKMGIDYFTDGLASKVTSIPGVILAGGKLSTLTTPSPHNSLLIEKTSWIPPTNQL